MKYKMVHWRIPKLFLVKWELRSIKIIRFKYWADQKDDKNWALKKENFPPVRSGKINNRKQTRDRDFTLSQKHAAFKLR